LSGQSGARIFLEFLVVDDRRQQPASRHLFWLQSVVWCRFFAGRNIRSWAAFDAPRFAPSPTSRSAASSASGRASSLAPSLAPGRTARLARRRAHRQSLWFPLSLDAFSFGCFSWLDLGTCNMISIRTDVGVSCGGHLHLGSERAALGPFSGIIWAPDLAALAPRPLSLAAPWPMVMRCNDSLLRDISSKLPGSQVPQRSLQQTFRAFQLDD